MQNTILLVENDQELLSNLMKKLNNKEYNVLTAKNKRELFDVYSENKINVQIIVLEWNLSDDGENFKILEDIRKESHIPIIILVDNNQISDMSHALAIGADDYVIKPVKIEELSARIKVALRHHNNNFETDDEIFRINDLTLNMKTHQVYRDGESLQLTRREFQLLVTLFKAQGNVISREKLLDTVWGEDFKGQPNIVDVYVRLLRQKIKDTDRTKRLIKTVRGVGYSIKKDR